VPIGAGGSPFAACHLMLDNAAAVVPVSVPHVCQCLFDRGGVRQAHCQNTRRLLVAMASEEEVPWPLFALNYLSDGQQ